MKVSDKYAILRSFESCLMQIEDILSDKTTINIQLYLLGRRIFGDRFVNVFTADDNIKLHNGQFCIVKTDASNKLVFTGSRFINIKISITCLIHLEGMCTSFPNTLNIIIGPMWNLTESRVTDKITVVNFV